MQATTPRLNTLSRLKTISAAGLTPREQPLVRLEALNLRGYELPVYRPSSDGVDAAEWLGHHSEEIGANLLAHGALLFRGFGLGTPAAFERFARAVCPDLFAENGEHPRGNLSEHVYTPVFYPPEKQLLWHNENSFNQQWPRLIWFCCARPADTGGETPLVDSRKVFARVDTPLREEFLRKGVMYARNYGEGLGLNWETVFRTTDRREVEARCREERMSFEWKDGNRLKTWCVRPAAVRHPETGEACWTNQAQHWHVYCLDPETRNALSSLFAPEDLPRSCCFGDGSPIPDDAMAAILAAYADLEYAFRWTPGDVVIVDNVLTAHGRNAFAGERKLLVAMGKMLDYGNLESVAQAA